MYREEKKNLIAELIKDPKLKPMKFRELAGFLQIPKEERSELSEILDALIREGIVAVDREGRYVCDRATHVTGEFFGTGRWQDTAGRNGYAAYSAWDAQGREWKFQKDVSIEGPDAEKCEMVTPILTYADIETLQELCRRLRKAGAKSDASRGCGVHIHIGADGHTPKTLRNLANIMASHESLLADALKLDRYRMSRYCRTVDPNFLRELNAKKPDTMAKLADIWYNSQGENWGRDAHYNGSRYHMLYAQ